jgi:hypothetical protein
MKSTALRWNSPASLGALAITSRMSFTPLLMALSAWKGASSSNAMSRAIVVLPTPGGPHRIMLGSMLRPRR